MVREIKVSLLTGGGDKPYALGMLNALVSKDVVVDFIGNDEMSEAGIIAHKNVRFFNLRGNQDPAASKIRKSLRVLRYYLRLLKYAASSDAAVFHVLWFNKFLFFDRTFLNMYYKLLGKKVVFTAHNIDERDRDGRNNLWNKLSLRYLYRATDHIFVHTEKMKCELIRCFNPAERKVTVIPFGINNTVPSSALTREEARDKLCLDKREKVLLFFGNIAPYKGVEYAILALDRLRREDSSFRLIIAGQIKGCQQYWGRLEGIIQQLSLTQVIIRKTEYIADDEVELYFKAADVLLLPYKFIYQSGVLFLSYNFGLPVIAADVGSLREDIAEGKTGIICRPADPDDLAEKIKKYFRSELFRNLEENMNNIRDYGNTKHSWDGIGNTICRVYKNLLNGGRPGQ